MIVTILTILTLSASNLAAFQPTAIINHQYHAAFTCEKNIAIINPLIHLPPARTTIRTSTILPLARSYGPPQPPPSSPDEPSPPDSSSSSSSSSQESITEQFTNLLHQITTAKGPEELPSIMTQHVDLLLSLDGTTGAKLLDDAMTAAEERDDIDTLAACEYVVSFIEEFVGQARAMDEENVQLLGEIIRAMKGETKGNGFGGSIGGGGGKSLGKGVEDVLNNVLEREKERFTPAFLRHIEGECRRIEEAPRMTPESSKLLQMLKTIQIRVIEELGKDLGEAALLLGQILGYEKREERLAVLKAGLTVRGLDFARELSELAQDALGGFEDMGVVADPELIAMVTEINDEIKAYVEAKSVLE